MIVNRINEYLSTDGKTLDEALLLETGKLAAYAFSRQFGVKEERKDVKPYFSSIGKCLRQQSYKLLGFEEDGKQIDSRSKMVFFMGDVVELAIVQLCKVAGLEVTGTGFEQEATELWGMRGRPDGVVNGTHVLEVKSMSSFSFRDFEGGKLDDGYRYQCNAAMESLKLDKCVIVALNKDAGVLAEMQITKDPTIVEDIFFRLDTLKRATKEELPQRPYAPDAKGFYPWQCLYCAFHKVCLPDADKVVVSGKYKLKAQKEAVA
jgi:hypothetical protein